MDLIYPKLFLLKLRKNCHLPKATLSLFYGKIFNGTAVLHIRNEHLSLKIPNIKFFLMLGFQHKCTGRSKPNVEVSFARYDKVSYFQF